MRNKFFRARARAPRDKTCGVKFVAVEFSTPVNARKVITYSDDGTSSGCTIEHVVEHVYVHRDDNLHSPDTYFRPNVNNLRSLAHENEPRATLTRKYILASVRKNGSRSTRSGSLPTSIMNMEEEKKKKKETG